MARGKYMSRSQSILITGASGNIGAKLRKHLLGRYEIRLLDSRTSGDPDIKQVDLANWDEIRSGHFEDIDTVIHLAAKPSTRAGLPGLIRPNIDATANVFEAAATAGVRRVVFASSLQVMRGYEYDRSPASIRADSPVRPWTRIRRQFLRRRETVPYAATKLFGERLGRLYAETRGLSVIAVRLGWVQSDSNPAAALRNLGRIWAQNLWLSNRDLCNLMERCITADLSDSFVIVNGLSRNTGMRWDISQTQDLLGYVPVDDVAQDAA